MRIRRHIAIRSLVAAAAFAGLSSPTQAQPAGLAGKASLEIDADVLARSSDADEHDGSASFGVTLRALIGGAHIFYGVGFSYRLGASYPGGFLYRAELLPLGLGTGISDIASFGVFAGAGVSGITSRVPFAGIFPVEARLDVRLGKRVAVGAFARAVWTSGEERDNGAISTDRADEISAGLRFRLSRYYPLQRRAYGTDGYFLAALLEERLGARFIGAAFGYSMDMGLK